MSALDKRNTPDDAARASSRSTVGGVAPQMGIAECIELASRECLDGECGDRVAYCDHAGTCLGLAEDRPF